MICLHAFFSLVPACPMAHPLVHLSESVCPPAHLPIRLSTCPSVCAPIRPCVHLPIQIPMSYAFALSARSQSPPMAHCDWMQNLFLSPLLQAQVACSQEITRNKTCHPPPRGRFTHDTADIANRQSSIFTQCTREIKLRMTTLPAGASHPLL